MADVIKAVNRWESGSSGHYENLAICYSVETYAVNMQSGKIYAIFITGWYLILEQASMYPFMVMPTPTSVP